MHRLPLSSLLAPGMLAGMLAAGCPAQPDPEPSLPAPICTEGTRFAAGNPAFRDATSDFGLDELGVEGVRISAADMDGDGWPDLVVRRGGFRRDDFGPDGARHTWLLQNEGGRFVDVTEASGLLTTRIAADGKGRPLEVVAIGDVNNDGALDLYTGVETNDLERSVGEASEVMLGDGAFGFSLAPMSELRRDGQLGAVDMPAGASFMDFDQDGALDLWVPQHNTPDFQLFPDRLYKGDGEGRFVEVGPERGLLSTDWSDLQALNEGRAHSRAWGSLACDLNDDGLPELLAPSYGRAPNHLWQAVREGGEVRFENRSKASGYAYDEDTSWQDNQLARCFCQQNPAAEGCAGVPAPAIGCGSASWSHDNDREPYRLGGNSGASLCADLDNDGALDVITGEIRHWWAGSSSDPSEVLLNSGEPDVRFERPGRDSLGLSIEHASASWDEGHMTGAVLDFDNDGWLDLYVGASDYPGNRGRLYRQAAPLAFEEVAPVDGIDHNRSHGVAVADFDRDGDLDVVVGHSRFRCDPAAPNDCYPTAQVRLFENLLGQGGNFVQLRLQGGEGSNRAAIGARVTAKAGEITQTREVGGGHGHYGSQDDLLVHFGLGEACEAEITVRWPDAGGAEGTEQSVTLPAGHRFELVQGAKPMVVPR